MDFAYIGFPTLLLSFADGFLYILMAHYRLYNQSDLHRSRSVTCNEDSSLGYSKFTDIETHLMPVGLASLCLSKVVLTTSCADSFPPLIRFTILHVIELHSIFKGLKAMLTHDRIGNSCSKISNFTRG